MRGTFIVLEGPDGSGTTLHSKLLAKALTKKGYDVLLTAEPSAGVIGRFIRKVLRETPPIPPDALQLLFCADRAKHLKQTILPALEEGKTVVCDRYIPSTIAYGEALGLDRAWLAEMNKNFIQSEVTILLLPPLEVSVERIGHRAETDMLETESLQAKVHHAYRRLADEGAIAHTLDSSGTKEETAKAILQLVEKKL